QAIEPHGPYGSQLSENYRMQLEEGDRITEVTIRHGAIVDAIGLTVAKKNGNTVYQQFGGNGGAPAKSESLEGTTSISSQLEFSSERNFPLILDYLAEVIVVYYTMSKYGVFYHDLSSHITCII
ncbi:Selenide water dikinase, partial [Bienertia sinuspersici]